MVNIKSPLRLFIEDSIKELIRGFRRQRIKWRNAFLLGSIMTTIVVLLHTPTFSVFSDEEETESSSSIYLNGSLHLNIQIVSSDAKVENLHALRTRTPIVQLNASEASGTVISRKRRKRRKKTKDELILPDPPPAQPRVLSSSEVRLYISDLRGFKFLCVFS